MAEDGPPKEIIYENTYITGPEGYGAGQKFRCAPVRDIVTNALKERLTGYAYDPIKTAQVAKELSDGIKEQVKGLGFNRYKFVVLVTLGQKRGQCQRIVSRCLWDTAVDNMVAETFESEDIYCVATVYGLYYE
ncbi:flagellar outer arm dynein light chain [Pycnococcus provasolii]